MDVKALQWELAAFVAERGLDPLHNPKNLAMALAAEAGRLLDLFKWLTEEQSRQTDHPERRAAAADATADIVVHALRLADELGIDLEDAVRKRVAKHAQTHPVPAPEAERSADPPRSDDPKKATARSAPEKATARREPEKATGRSDPVKAPDRNEARREPPIRSPEVTETASPVQPTARSSAVPQREASRAQKEAPPSARAASPPAATRPAVSASRPEPRRGAETTKPAPAAPPPPVEADSIPPDEQDRYNNLDMEAISEFLRGLSRRVDGTHSDHPTVRELQDEIGTLRRTLYAKTVKRAWVGASLNHLRTMLEQAASESIGPEIRAKEHIAQIDRLLEI
jgi:NTP pyrophosphatase (non-canonical NTP hydrolase)